MERRVERFFAADKGRGIGKEGTQFGHITLIGGKPFALADIIERDLSNAVLAIQQAGIAGIKEVWESNVYDFARLLNAAQRIHKERTAEIERQKARKTR